ncbi:MAG: valine--tRNA ligase [Candidatus Buchananbacteria bacterium]
MSKQEISKTYEANKVEDAIYKQWQDSGFFNPDNLPKNPKSPFTISMPPPNATGVLHLGHAVMLAIQDLVIRFQRMQGKRALWLPGTDHAAIATQTKVEKIIKKKEGKTRHDLGRQEFLKRVDEFVAESRNTIKGQVKKMGSSCDWSRERYTLDEGLNVAVNQAFVEMYNDGLIYQGARIVNWCPSCASTLADDEVEYNQQKGKFYYIKYGPFVVATTRPETKIGDTAVAVNPNDARYKDYIGQQLDINLGKVKVHVKVIGDESIDQQFGTGAVGVTPAHSLVDYEMAQKNNLPLIQVIGPDGKMTNQAGPYAGLTVAECRQQFLADLEQAGLIEKIEEVDNNLSVCYRCDHVIEPLISKQWFINVNKPVKKFGGKTIKDQALAVVKNGEIQIIPDRFEKTYYHWLENLRDWCISRQIWFGHRIPVWYKGQEIYVGQTAPKEDGWQQDPDTLDTWFSSGLWTFSTLGWPQKTKDLKTFHPTSLMETGYDILFFWVARMIIMSNYFMEEIPFEKVYLHGMVRDEKGRKMSKSLDNSIDPLDMISKYGADATRLSLVIGTTPGNDLVVSEAKIAGYRNFINKLWNISRFILMNVGEVKIIKKAPKPKTLADQWILSELDSLVDFSTKNLAVYNFSLVGEKIYEFTWSKLADWYLEVAKIEGQKDEILLYVLQTLLKLWHPFTPFVTEEIGRQAGFKNLMIIEPWPKAQGKLDKKAVKDFELIEEIISAIRNLRAESKIPPAKKINAIIVSAKQAKLIKSQTEVIKSLARLEDLAVLAKSKKITKALSAIVSTSEIYLPVSGMIDIEKEVPRLEQEAERLADFIVHLEQKLANETFVTRAPKDIVAAEKEKLELSKENLEKINQQLKTLK